MFSPYHSVDISPLIPKTAAILPPNPVRVNVKQVQMKEIQLDLLSLIDYGKRPVCRRIPRITQSVVGRARQDLIAQLH